MTPTHMDQGKCRFVEKIEALASKLKFIGPPMGGENGRGLLLRDK